MQRELLKRTIKQCDRSSGLLRRPCTSARWHTSSAAKPTSGRELVVLGLESSADDTCAAVLSVTLAGEAEGTKRWAKPKLRSSVVINQSMHELYGGIHPQHALEAHQRNMPVAIKRALVEAGVEIADVDAIAATRGPGGHGALGVGLGAGKTLAAALGKPLLAVHHMQAHALTPFLTEDDPPSFPFLSLLLSGGHTLLILATSFSQFKILATTADESIGGAFDKAARELKLPWSLGGGSPGAALEAFADFKNVSSPFVAPPAGATIATEDGIPVFPLANRGKLEFSYSGLRTSLASFLSRKGLENFSPEQQREIARRFVFAAVEQIREKTRLGMRELERNKAEGSGIGALVVSGGVARNKYLRERLRKLLDDQGYSEMRLIFPPPSLCTDNAAMIANVGISRLLRDRVDSLGVMQIAKWSIDQCEQDFGG